MWISLNWFKHNSIKITVTLMTFLLSALNVTLYVTGLEDIGSYRVHNSIYPFIYSICINHCQESLIQSLGNSLPRTLSIARIEAEAESESVCWAAAVWHCHMMRNIGYELVTVVLAIRWCRLGFYVRQCVFIVLANSCDLYLFHCKNRRQAM